MDAIIDSPIEASLFPAIDNVFNPTEAALAAMVDCFWAMASASTETVVPFADFIRAIVALLLPILDNSNAFCPSVPFNISLLYFSTASKSMDALLNKPFPLTLRSVPFISLKLFPKISIDFTEPVVSSFIVLNIWL